MILSLHNDIFQNFYFAILENVKLNSFLEIMLKFLTNVYQMKLPQIIRR